MVNALEERDPEPFIVGWQEPAQLQASFRALFFGFYQAWGNTTLHASQFIGLFKRWHGF